MHVGDMDLMHTAHVPAGEGPFPTILAFHGWGANAHDLFGIAPAFHGGQALVLCPTRELATQVADAAAVAASARAFQRGDNAVPTATVRSIGLGFVRTSTSPGTSCSRIKGRLRFNQVHKKETTTATMAPWITPLMESRSR